MTGTITRRASSLRVHADPETSSGTPRRTRVRHGVPPEVTLERATGAYPYLDALPHHVWLASPRDGRVIFFNQAWHRYTGLGRAEALHGGSVRTIHPDDRARFETAWMTALRSVRPFDLELRVCGRDGAYRWFAVHAEPVGAEPVSAKRVRAVPVRASSVEITEWIGTQTDIEERKRFDAATREVAHDLRAPLHAIAVAAALGQREDARTALEGIACGVRRMDHLIRDILGPQRSGESLLERTPADLGAAVRCALEDLKPDIVARGVQVILPPRWPAVWCAPVELYRVALNLLGNAVRYAGHDGAVPTVEVACRQTDTHVVLHVSDNGPGIAAKHRERVFEPGCTLERERLNTGLGLGIVRRILERHGGSVRIEPSPLGGARFAVHFRREG